MSVDSGAHVAPLQVQKGPTSGVIGSLSQHQTTRSNSSCPNGQMTPPLTPHEPESAFDRPGDFQSYLRAFYPYHPSHEEESSTQILPLNSGDLILVHSVHTNGWADGTLLMSGARGWLPTNYCEGYENEPISSLLRALTTFWDRVRSNNTSGLHAFQHSDYVKGLVAGVRCLLERTDCLNRESHLVRGSPSIRRNRKALLSDLSSFVKVTKNLESRFSHLSTEGNVELDMNDMIMKAFKVVTRAVKFTDAWDDQMQSIDAAANQAQVPPTPPADRTEFETLQDLDPVPSNQRSQDVPAQADNDARDLETPTNNLRPHCSRSSQTYVRPGSSNSCKPPYRPRSRHGARDSASHRVSCNIHPGSQNLASEKLTGLHNDFLTLLGYFIGLHLQSRSSSELLLTTKQSVLACKDMLELITEVWERDWKRSHDLGDARDNMYRKITELAEAAYSIFRPLRAGTEDDFVLPGEGRPLMDAATACVRAAGESVAESRVVIDRIGDFTFEPLRLAFSNVESAVSSTKDAEPETVIEPKGQGTIRQVHSSPLQPLIDPPPPPESVSDSKPSTDSVPEDHNHGSDTLPEKDTERSNPQDPETLGVLLPPLPPFAVNHASTSQEDLRGKQSADEKQDTKTGRLRTDSLGLSSGGESSTYVGSTRDSESSAVSQSSTRATSPDITLQATSAQSSFSSENSCSQRSNNGDAEDPELNILERTFAHELVFNKEGQITGGTLPALIERLTTPDTTPDASFVSTFFLTFRLFATPVAFAQALVDRFQYVGDSPRIAAPVRLRVYNVFKGWLESHWRNDCDKAALEVILPFATRQLQIVLPTAGKQLVRLTEQVTVANGPLVPRLVSSIGKTNTSIAQYVASETPLPPPAITKSQLAALSGWKYGGKDISILDFDPLELARQFTLKESQIFCSILPEELLASEWTKKTGSMAVNVRAMSRLSTDLTNLVTDSILQVDDPKKRASTIKQWVKIANKFLELANYHSLMAIICSLTQSTIGRLKRTWELVSNKTKTLLESLKSVVDHDRNYAALRQRLQNHMPPCVPFVGLYLTDLTFVDAGNQTTRHLPGSSPSQRGRQVINFDKHMKTAKIISELQRFQIPYRFNEIPELQTWMQDQLVRVRTNDQSDMVKDYYRRSLLLEPRELPVQCKPSPTESQTPGKDKFEIFSIGWSHHSREKLATTPP